MKTQAKSLIVQVLTTIILVIGSAGSLLSAKAAAFAGIISAAFTLILNEFFPSGELVQGWSLVLWVTNLGAVALQIINMIGTVTFIDPAVINYLTIGINTLILVIAKNYGNGALIGKN